MTKKQTNNNLNEQLMKKLLYAIAALAMTVFVAGCNKEMEKVTPNGNTVKATFTIQLPETVATKAINDGLNANKLLFRAYDENGNLLGNLSKTVDVAAKHATVEVDLVKDLQYQFVFWAQKDATYAISEDGKSITVDPAAMMNNGAYDAFYWHEPTFTVTAAFNKAVTLKRPFAQLNVGAPDGDFSSANASGIATDATLKTIYEITVPNKLNLLEGTVEGGAVIASTTVDNAVSHPTDILKVGDVNYDYAAMLYVLAPASGNPAIKDVTLKLFTTQTAGNAAAVAKTFTRVVPNVPLKANYRTNILGRIFTVGAAFDITVDNEFASVDGQSNDYTPEYTTIANLNAAFADGKGIGYQVAVTTPESETIVLPKTNDDVRIFLRGDWSEKTVTLAYAEGATAAQKPVNVYILAPSLYKLMGEITSTHVEIEAGSTIDTGDLSTSGSTLVIQKLAKVINLIIRKGSLKVAGEVETATVKASAEGASTVVTSTGEVETLNIETGSVALNGANAEGSGAVVNNLNIDNTSDSVESVVIATTSAVASVAITGDAPAIKDESGNSPCIVTSLAELAAAIGSNETNILYTGEEITSISETITLAPTVATKIAGLKVNVTATGVTPVVSINGPLTLSASIVTKAYCALAIQENNTVTLDGCTISNVQCSSENGRAVNIFGNTTITIRNSSVNGPNPAGYSRALNFLDPGIKATIVGSKISVGHYALNFPGDTTGAEIILTDSTVDTGWAITNIWDESNSVTFNNCSLNSLNDKTYNADGWNDFSAFVYNEGAQHNVITVNNSATTVRATTGNNQSLFSFRDKYNSLIFNGGSILGETNGPSWNIVSSMDNFTTATLEFNNLDSFIWNGEDGLADYQE